MIDNTVAEGLAADTINAKCSKSMDVRFFWFPASETDATRQEIDPIGVSQVMKPS
jgi:hypothetical protein